MNIHLAEHYGLCFGVRDAIQQAERLARQGPLTILGDLVHNPIVTDRLAAMGVAQQPLGEPGQSATRRVMITAHGASDMARAGWSRAGYLVEDSTCPLVRHAHEQLRRLVAGGCFPVIIGKRGHVEVRGLSGDFPEAFILENEADLGGMPARQRYGVIAQTTQPISRVRHLVALLQERHRHAEVRFCDTVCRPTKDRQRALRKLIESVQMVIVVGGHHSNNTRELVQTVQAAGLPAHHIQHPDELRVEWLAGIEDIGLTGGTSTLPETVAAVRHRLESIACRQKVLKS